MDYIFKEWEKRLSTFESSVEKDLQEIRQCKAEMQQMQLDITAEIRKGRYIRDTQRLVLSAPEIVIAPTAVSMSSVRSPKSSARPVRLSSRATMSKTMMRALVVPSPLLQYRLEAVVCGSMPTRPSTSTLP